MKRFGYVAEEVVGTSGWDYVHPDDLDQARAQLRRAALAGTSSSVEWRLRAGGGE